jgi:glycosyltransferase involved in cell wall biosynthesis/predicted SAM-dependent methyltransferase
MDQGIGNMVMLTPALRAIKQAMPRCRLTVLGSQPSLGVIAGWDVIDKSISEPDDSYYDVCFRTIWSDEYESLYGQRLRRQCSKHFSVEKGDPNIHESVYDLKIATLLGYSGAMPEPYCAISDVILSLPEDKTIVALGDTALAGDFWARKRWPHYPELARRLIEKSYVVVLIGGKIEADRFDPREWPEPVINCLGIYTVPQTASILKKCDLFIGNDSGPAHLSAALGVQTYVIFGPTLISKNRPLGSKVTVISKDLDCSPCQYTDQWNSCNTWSCMKQITVENVLSAIASRESCNSSIIRTNGGELKLVGKDYSACRLIVENHIKYLVKDGIKERFRIQLVGARRANFPWGMENEILRALELEGVEVLDTDYREDKECFEELFLREAHMMLVCKGSGISPDLVEQYPGHTILWYQDDVFSTAHAPRDLAYNGRAFDAVFSFDKAALEEYRKYGIKNVKWLPLAMSPAVHRKMYLPKKYDVSFVGNIHPNRKPFLERLQKRFQIFVTRAFMDEMVQIFNQSKIVLNLGIGPTGIQQRVFEALGCGAFLLTNEIPEDGRLFEDRKHLVYFNDENIEGLIGYYLKNEDEREAIALNGYLEVQERHTFRHRIEKIIREIVGTTDELQSKGFIKKSNYRTSGWRAAATGRCEQALDVDAEIQRIRKESSSGIEPMRILYLTPPGYKDVKTPQMIVAEELVRRGHRVHIVVTDGNISINPKDYDVIYAAMEASCLGAAELKRRTGLPLYAHGEWVPLWRVGFESPEVWGHAQEDVSRVKEEVERYREYYTKIIQAMASAEVCSMAGTAFIRDAERLAGVSLPNSFVKYPSVDVRTIQSLPQNLEEETRIVTVSRLVPNKKAAMTAEALKLLDDPPEWVIVGYGPEEERIGKILSGTRVRFQVLKGLHGPDKFREIRRSLFGVQNWSGIPPAEEMLLGKPCISFAHPYMKELYGDTLIWCRNNDVEHQAEAIQNLLRTGLQKRKEIARRGRERLFKGELGVTTVEVGAAIVEAGLLLAIRKGKRRRESHVSRPSAPASDPYKRKVVEATNRIGMLKSSSTGPCSYSENPLEIMLFGYAFSHMSWSYASRELALALHRLGHKVLFNCLDIGLYDKDRHEDNLMLSLCTEKDAYGDLNIYSRLVDNGQIRDMGNLNCLWWVNETNTFPKMMQDQINRQGFDFALVYNEDMKEWLQDQVAVPLVVIWAAGIRSEQFSPDKEAYDYSALGVKTDTFKFYYSTRRGYRTPIAPFGGRKGLDIAVESFVDEFTGDEDVCLIIRLAGDGKDLKNWSLWTKTVVYPEGHWVTDYVRSVQASKKNPPKILFFTENIPLDRLAGTYTGTDCFVHPFRAAGWEYPVMEAMACGIPIIATKLAGPRAFGTEDNAVLLDFELVAGDRWKVEGTPTVKPELWAEPNRKQLRAAMRMMFEDRDRAKAMGSNGALHIRQNWTWEKAAQRIAGFYRHVLGNGKLLARKVNPSDGAIRLNLGCGEKAFKGYHNIDLFRWNPEAIVADARDLCLYKDNSVEEILAFDLLEHLSFWETGTTLKEWSRVLKPGGRIHIQCPSLGSLTELYMKGKVSAEKFVYQIFGGQDHPGNFHKAAFDARLLEKCLVKAGIQVTKVEHVNTPSTENLRILGVKQ